RRSLRQGIVEGRGVAPEVVRAHGDFVPASNENDVRAQRLTQVIERLAQGCTGMLLIQLWPEQPHELVAAVVPTRGGDREKGQKRESLRLGKHRPDSDPVLLFETDGAEDAKANHCTPLWYRRGFPSKERVGW